MAPAVVYKIQYGTQTAGVLDSPAKSTAASVELSDTVGIEEVTDMMHEAMHAMGVPEYLVVEEAAAADAEAAKTRLDAAKLAEAERHKAAEAKLAALTKKEAERHKAAEAKLAAAEQAAKVAEAAAAKAAAAKPAPAHPGATPVRP